MSADAGSRRELQFAEGAPPSRPVRRDREPGPSALAGIPNLGGAGGAPRANVSERRRVPGCRRRRGAPANGSSRRGGARARVWGERGGPPRSAVRGGAPTKPTGATGQGARSERPRRDPELGRRRRGRAAGGSGARGDTGARGGAGCATP